VNKTRNFEGLQTDLRFSKNFNIVTWQFPEFGLHLWKEWSNLYENFTHLYCWTCMSPPNFATHLVRSPHNSLQIHMGFTLG